MDVFCPKSDKTDSRSTTPDNGSVSLLRITPELALPAAAIVAKLQSATLEQVSEIVDRHLWPKFYSSLDSRQDNPGISEKNREELLAAMGVHFDREPAKRRINQSILNSDWNKVIEIIVSKLDKRNKSLDPKEEIKFIESKDEWYARYCHRQSLITLEYAKLVSSRIVQQGWTDVGISPAEFIFIAKPLYETAANKAGYYRASNAAKSSIPILGSLVSDNWYGARVKELFLAPYLEEYRRLEALSGKKFL